MSTKDIKSNLESQLALLANVTGNGTTNGLIIDTGDSSLGLMTLPLTSDYVDGTYTFILEESNDPAMAGANQILDGDLRLIGTLAALTQTGFPAEGAILPSVGVVDTLQYIRFSVVATGVTNGARIRLVLINKKEILQAF